MLNVITHPTVNVIQDYDEKITRIADILRGLLGFNLLITLVIKAQKSKYTYLRICTIQIRVVVDTIRNILEYLTSSSSFGGGGWQRLHIHSLSVSEIWAMISSLNHVSRFLKSNVNYFLNDCCPRRWSGCYYDHSDSYWKISHAKRSPKNKNAD